MKVSASDDKHRACRPKPLYPEYGSSVPTERFHCPRNVLPRAGFRAFDKKTGHKLRDPVVRIVLRQQSATARNAEIHKWKPIDPHQ